MDVEGRRGVENYEDNAYAANGETLTNPFSREHKSRDGPIKEKIWTGKASNLHRIYTTRTRSKCLCGPMGCSKRKYGVGLYGKREGDPFYSWVHE